MFGSFLQLIVLTVAMSSSVRTNVGTCVRQAGKLVELALLHLQFTPRLYHIVELASEKLSSTRYEFLAYILCCKLKNVQFEVISANHAKILTLEGMMEESLPPKPELDLRPGEGMFLKAFLIR